MKSLILVLSILAILSWKIDITPMEYTRYDPIEHAVNALAKCESSFNVHAVHYHDGSNRNSIGLLQFQERTFKYLGERYNLPHDDIHSVMEQKAIAYEAINRGEWKHWKVCGEKLNLQGYKK